MKHFLIATVFALTLIAVPAPAQQPITHDRAMYPPLNYGFPRPIEHTMEEMGTAREKLIKRYVLADPRLAWGVSICGSEDVLTGEPDSWLTVYVYSDSLNAFALDYDKFATHTKQHTLQVDGITVVVEVVNRKPKGETHEPAKTERNDRQPAHTKNSGGNAVVSGRPSRA